jgi:hypothetical protein
VEDGQNCNVLAPIRFERAPQHEHPAAVDIPKGDFGCDMASTNAPLAHSFNVLLFITPGNEEHFDAEPVQTSSAYLIEGNFSKRRLEGEGLAPVDAFVDEALHLLPGLLSKLHVQGNVGGNRLKYRLTPPVAFPNKVAARRSVLNASICTWKIGKMEDLPPPEGPATITMRGTNMPAGLLLHAQLGVHIAEMRSVSDAPLFVDEPSAERLHPLFADERIAMSNQGLVEGLTFGGVFDVYLVHVEGILESMALLYGLRSVRQTVGNDRLVAFRPRQTVKTGPPDTERRRGIDDTLRHSHTARALDGAGYRDRQTSRGKKGQRRTTEAR